MDHDLEPVVVAEVLICAAVARHTFLECVYLSIAVIIREDSARVAARRPAHHRVDDEARRRVDEEAHHRVDDEAAIDTLVALLVRGYFPKEA